MKRARLKKLLNQECIIEQQEGLDLRDKPTYGQPQHIPCLKVEKQSFTRQGSEDKLITYVEYICTFQGLNKDKDKIDGMLIGDVQEVKDLLKGDYLFTKVITFK